MTAIKVGSKGHYCVRTAHVEIDEHDELLLGAGDGATSMHVRTERPVADSHRCFPAIVVAEEVELVAAHDPDEDARAEREARVFLASPELGTAMAHPEAGARWRSLADAALEAIRIAADHRLRPPAPAERATGLLTVDVRPPDEPETLRRAGIAIGLDPSDGIARFHLEADCPWRAN